MNSSYLIKNAKIVLETKVLQGDLLVLNGIISKIEASIVNDTVPNIDAKNEYLCPGLFEMHIHGQNGYSFEDIQNEETGQDIIDIHNSLASKGINTYLPTFSCQEDKILLALKFFKKYNLFEYSIPGIYIEGPFINKEKRGGLAEKTISSFSIKELESLWNKMEGKIKIMTFAPEFENSGVMADFLLNRNAIPSVGHTNGKLEDFQKLIENRNESDFSMTHLYNAMTHFSHRFLGMSFAPFKYEKIFFELITDGIHINPEII